MIRFCVQNYFKSAKGLTFFMFPKLDEAKGPFCVFDIAIFCILRYSNPRNSTSKLHILSTQPCSGSIVSIFSSISKFLKQKYEKWTLFRQNKRVVFTWWRFLSFVQTLISRCHIKTIQIVSEKHFPLLISPVNWVKCNFAGCFNFGC